MAARKNAGRVTIATVSAITTARARRGWCTPPFPAKPASAARAKRHRRGRRDRNDFRQPRTDAPPVDGVTTAVAAEARRQARRAKTGAAGHRASVFKARAGTTTGRSRANQGRPQDKPAASSVAGDRDKGGGRDKGGFGGKGGRDSGPSHRQWATSAAPRERDRPVDPNSPFAKLAALKEQLAGNRKD